MLADGDGHRGAWEWIGAPSMKPCLRHCNVLELHSGLAHRRDCWVELDCEDHARFRRWQARDVFATVDAIIAVREKVDAGEM
eukprot:8316033-Pyramimonas_sp.AAC.1